MVPAHLQHVLELIDAEPQLSHAGLEELPQAVLLHQPHEHAEGFLLRHLGRGRQVGGCECGRGGRGCSLFFSWPQNMVLGLFLFHLCLLNADYVGYSDSHNKVLINIVTFIY